MNDIPRGTSLLKLIKCLQPPGYGQSSPTSRLHDVQVGIVIQDSRLDDELSVATIEFRDTPAWLSQDPCGFPKVTALGTLWRAVDWNAVDEHGRTEFIRAVMKLEGSTRNALCYAEMLAEFNETDVNVQDNQGRTALHWACVYSYVDMVMVCLSVPDCLVGLKDNDGLTAFDISMRNTDRNECIPNLFYKSMFDMGDRQPQAALLRALTITSEPAIKKSLFPGAAMFTPIAENDERLVEALIGRGVDLTATNEAGDTALHLAAAKPDNVAITTRLLNAGSDVNAIGQRGATPLHYAVGSADVEMVKLLLHHDADRSSKDHSERTALQLAEEDRKQDLVVILAGSTTDTIVVLAPPADWSDTPSSATELRIVGDMPDVHAAVDSRAILEPPAVKKQDLIRERELINGNKTLLEAASDGDLDTVRYHLRLGTDLELLDRRSVNALQWAAARGHTEIVEALLAGGARIHAVSGTKCTALHYAAEYGHLETLQVLILNGVDMDARSARGHTAMQLAVTYKHRAVVKHLLDCGATIPGLSRYQGTSLQFAARYGSTKTVAILIKNGAMIEQCSWINRTALHEASNEGQKETILVLLDSGANLEAPTSYNETALHLAAEQGHTEVVECLIARGENIEALTLLHKTALHMSAQKGHTEVVEYLIARGANIEVLAAANMTVLHLAAQRGHIDIVKRLIACGAKVESLSLSKETALQMAIRNGRRNVVEVLKAAGAHSSPGDYYRYGVLKLRGARK